MQKKMLDMMLLQLCSSISASALTRQVFTLVTDRANFFPCVYSFFIDAFVIRSWVHLFEEYAVVLHNSQGDSIWSCVTVIIIITACHPRHHRRRRHIHHVLSYTSLSSSSLLLSISLMLSFEKETNLFDLGGGWGQGCKLSTWYYQGL